MRIIIGSRQTGKTTRLLKEIEAAKKEGKTVALGVHNDVLREHLVSAADRCNIDISGVKILTHGNIIIQEKVDEDVLFLDDAESFLKRFFKSKGTELSALTLITEEHDVETIVLDDPISEQVTGNPI